MPSILASRGWAVIINRVDSQQEIVMVALNEELSGIADRPQRYLGSTAGSRGTNPGSPGSMSRNHPRSVPYCSDSYFPGPDFSRHYARNRNYSPSLGRWISQDPAGYINGANTYQFVMSNPVGNVDPWGTGTPYGGIPYSQWQKIHPVPPWHTCLGNDLTIAGGVIGVIGVGVGIVIPPAGIIISLVGIGIGLAPLGAPSCGCQ